MNLKDLKINTKSVTTEFSALPGFKVTIGYMGKTALRKIVEESTEATMDSAGNVTDKFDQDTYIKKFCAGAVLGWEGLTIEKLAQLVLIDESMVKDVSEELEYSEDNAYDLLQESVIFDNWVSERVSNLSTFRS